MKLSNPGVVPVYTISGASTARPLPDWLARRRKRSLKNDAEYQNRVELLQDFEFEEASSCIRISDDGEWVMSTGTYKPQIHVHNLPQLSLSFARHTTSLNHSFELLSSDYSKSLHLQTDRRLEFHTPMGCHYEVRIPRYGRGLVYDRQATEALVPSVGLDTDGKGEVFRLNLEIGRFMKSYQVDVGGDDHTGGGLQGGIGVGSVNTAAIADDTHNLLAFGTSMGTIEFWDPRSKTRIALLTGNEGEVTALDFSPSGLSLASGTSTGMIKIFDLRRPVPLLRKDHGYGFPVQKLIHMTTSSQEKKVLSADKRIIKLWDEQSGDPWTSVEPIVDINDVTWCKDTGMLLTANEGKQQHAFFVPQLGPAPKWCSFLDSMVEEMAEDAHTETYDNYKFLTVPELRELSLSHLVGKTNLLRPYMHGYFVASKLYEQAKLIANPYGWEEEKMKRVKDKVEKERASRIRGRKVKVNQRLVDKMLKKQENRDKVDTSAGILGDDRFAQLFEDEEFRVDETSGEFKALNPSTTIEQRAEPGAPTHYQGRDSEDESDDESDDGVDKDSLTLSRKPKEDVVMRVSSTKNDGPSLRDTALGSRQVKSGRNNRALRGDAVGERHITFMPASKKKQEQEQPENVPARKLARDARRSASYNTFRKM